MYFQLCELLLTVAETAWCLPIQSYFGHGFMQVYVISLQRLKVKSPPICRVAYLCKNTEINRSRFCNLVKDGFIVLSIKEFACNYALCVRELPSQIPSCCGFVLSSVAIASCLGFACSFTMVV